MEIGALIGAVNALIIYIILSLWVNTVGQVTIYLDDETEQRLKYAAAAAEMPVSRWVAGLVKEHTRTKWPETIRELPGNWPDFPDIDALRRETEDDVPRETV